MNNLTVATKQITQTRSSDRDTFHAFMVKGACFEGPFDIPKLDKVVTTVNDLIAFPDAVSSKCNNYDKFVHFYTDDWRFERFWNSPQKYLKKLKKFNGVIEADFSTCPNFPEALKIYNTYRNRACSRWMQDNGITVIPNLRVELRTLDYALNGVSKNSTIAIGSHGCIKNLENRSRFVRSLKCVIDTLEPTNIIVYGSDAYGVFDYPRSQGIPVDVFSANFGNHNKDNNNEH